MPVPATITDLSTTPSSNSPAGTETPTLGDDYVRTLSAFIASLRDKLNGTTGSNTLLTTTLNGDTTASYVLTPAVSGVVAYRLASTTYAAGTNTLVFDTESADRASNYDNATGIFTAPKTGLYQVNIAALLQNNTVSSITITSTYLTRNNSVAAGFYFNLGGVSQGATVSASSNAFVVGGGYMVSLAATDTLRVVVVHTGAALTLGPASHLSIAFVG